MSNEQEGLFTRWSRRKSQSKEVNELEDEQIIKRMDTCDIEPQKNDQPCFELQEDSPPVLTDADMPDIETLNEDSDFSPFMSSGVSDQLRNLALKKMFSAPVFNIRDGLDEYDEDYTSFEPLGDLITCDMKHQMEREAQKRMEQAQQAMLSEEDNLERESGVESSTPAESSNTDDVCEQQDKSAPVIQHECSNREQPLQETITNKGLKPGTAADIAYE